MTNELNPDGKCQGPSFKGCPNDRMASGLTEQRVPGGLIMRTIRYHCPECFEIYRRRYA